jgi:DNA-binding transcriptional regulator YdaS (Cro superfamily)
MAIFDLEQTQALIARAATALGSEYKLAQALGVNDNEVRKWKVGKRNCVPADRARIAALAGDDPVQELVRATIAQAPGETRKEQLRNLLGKLSHRTGAGHVFAALAALGASGEYLIRCILC